MPSIAAVHRELARRSPHWFIFDSGFVKTKDEHDLDTPVKPFPNKAYLRVLLDCLCLTGKIIKPEEAIWAKGADLDPAVLLATGQFGVEKSRQILATWLVSAYCLWRAKFRQHQLVLWQSKKEEDAANVVFTKDPTNARMSFMETQLPPSLRDCTFPRDGAWCNLYFRNSGSRIWGIPEGGDIVRSNTPSVLVSDEAAFQPAWEEAQAAAKPAVDGGGQFIAISSAAPGAFARWVGAEGA